MAEDNDYEDVLPPPPAPGLIESLVREKPIAALLGAVVIGVLLGRLGIL